MKKKNLLLTLFVVAALALNLAQVAATLANTEKEELKC